MIIQGAILCGGKSSRFGSDKALAPLMQKDTPVLVSLYELLLRLKLNPIVLCGEQNRYADFGLKGIEDVFKNCGPLSGLHSGLNHSKANALLFLTVDMPLVTDMDINTLISVYQKNKSPTFFKTSERLSPFPGIYTKGMLPGIVAALQSKTYSVQKVLDSTKDYNVISHDLGEHFKNVNTNRDWCDFYNRPALPVTLEDSLQ